MLHGKEKAQNPLELYVLKKPETAQDMYELAEALFHLKSYKNHQLIISYPEGMSARDLLIERWKTAHHYFKKAENLKHPLAALYATVVKSAIVVDYCRREMDLNSIVLNDSKEVRAELKQTTEQEETIKAELAQLEVEFKKEYSHYYDLWKPRDEKDAGYMQHASNMTELAVRETKETTLAKKIQAKEIEKLSIYLGDLGRAYTKLEVEKEAAAKLALREKQKSPVHADSYNPSFYRNMFTVKPVLVIPEYEYITKGYF